MSVPLWTGLALVGVLDARVSGPLPASVSGVSIDTRTLEKSELFFAIKGENNDGHDFVAAAFERGAAACVIDEAHGDAHIGKGACFVVRDTLAALERLGRAGRHRSHAHIVAVTGSVGKTSTKEALRTVCSTAGATHVSVASYNNHWGVPLTLARMPADTEYGVFEIGMNHAGEITPLVGMVRPHVAMITKIAPVHLEYFESIEGIADAKAEIFSGLVENGVAILNRDDAQFGRLRERAHACSVTRILSFGEHADAEARLTGLELSEDSSRVHARILDRDFAYELGVPGKHFALNSLAVLLAAHAAGVDLERASAALAYIEAPAGRGRRENLRVAEGQITLIDESYNANPASMQAALDLLGSARVSDVGRRIAVLGDMLELGAQSIALHSGLADHIERNSVDVVFAAGNHMRHLFDALPERIRGAWAPRASELHAPVIEAIHGGDIVMVKGSNGSRMGPLVAALRDHFRARPASAEG
ncbi:MAG TPA: UDP-N-acetylmuramoylalanyl-D-glutamyl-2,6-diaminopimelate--D-alanyl-D-alanine ligase [Beijerinckiaceae bacterium]|jgi:UDP-N-acetylmuramoyl-tripeptide--D-alanyl-D-alanine ligase|nr:UDP-N-acetylmuramoylalanyl-D-glutamyl-2,6-diaminopimelate--D-alanyl-D-alanine ligase [Beijerinckiaceae bacterium]